MYFTVSQIEVAPNVPQFIVQVCNLCGRRLGFPLAERSKLPKECENQKCKDHIAKEVAKTVKANELEAAEDKKAMARKKNNKKENQKKDGKAGD